MNKSKKNTITYCKPKAVDSLMVMCTYACQLVCNYCEVKQMNSFMSEETLNKAIKLLLTTQSKQCQLRFWGGEPLLRWDFIRKGILYAKQRAQENEKKIKFMITTNGLLLDHSKINFLKNHPVEIMFSLDGDIDTNRIHRTTYGGRQAYNKLIKNLLFLDDSGIPYFVNMVVTDITVNNLVKNLAFLKNLKIKKVQLCYRCGIYWTKVKREKLVSEINNFFRKYKDNLFLMNFRNSCEPTMLSQEIIVDTDEKLYFDGAIFMENKFPDLRKHYLLGRLEEITNIDALYNSKSELYLRFKRACSNKEERKIFSNNINLGLKLDNFFSGLSRDSLDSNEHPLLIPIVKGDFFSQRRVINRLGINALFLYIDGPCLNNCLFCKHKDESFSDLFKIILKLKSNLRIKTRKLCIIGNEPLLHPEIEEIVRLARKYGFRKIEIMTSGNLLSDKVFCAKLIKAGARSFSFPLFAAKEDVHDFIVGRQGAFYGVTRAIKNILSLRGEVFIHTNLLRQNIDHLKDLENFVEKQLSLPFVILPVRPKSAPMEFREIMPSYDEVIKKLKGINSLVGFPLCVVKHVQKDLLKSGKEISDSMKLYFLDQKFSKLKTCVGCRQYNKCSGFAKEYVEDYSDDFISPFN